MSPRTHEPPAGSDTQRQELLYDPEVPTPTHAEYARTLVSRVSTGALCTLAQEPAGYPYGSFVTFAMEGAAPVFLLSRLAEHTRNLLGDPRASLLVTEPGEGDPLARGRVTLLGTCTRLDQGAASQGARAAFLQAHPGASYYFDFGDFSLFRLQVSAIRYIGGYGRMSWVKSEDFGAAAPDPIAPLAEGIIAHMNADHADTMVLYCKAFTRATDTTHATMKSVDRYGFEISALTGAGPRPIRLGFSRPVGTAEEVRAEMVALARRARAS